MCEAARLAWFELRGRAIARDGRVTLARSLPPASVQEIYSERRLRDRES